MASKDTTKRESDLIRKRGVIKSRCTSFANSLNKYHDASPEIAELLPPRLKRVEEDLGAFRLIQDALEELASDEMFEIRLRERVEFEETHEQIVESAHSVLAKLNLINTNSRHQQNIPDSANSPLTIISDTQARLPTMDLPKFSGSYEAWPGFSEAFRSAVHDNPSFRDHQILLYLKSCLTGRVANKIESLPMTAASYPVAWELLEKSFNDPAIIINNRVQAIFDLPACTKFNAASLEELLDSASKHYRALEALNRPFLEAFPIYAITSKLDAHTRLCWKEKTQGNPSPTMDDLFNFLQSRHKLLDTSSYDRFNKPTKPQPPVQSSTGYKRATTSYSAIKSHCQICKGTHFTHACSTLINTPVKKRIEVVTNAGLCTNCLRSNHVVTECIAGNCKQCGEKHHTLLHLEAPSLQTTILSNTVSLKTNSMPEIILSTATVDIFDQYGRPHRCRLLLDSGSQSNFLSERMLKKLNLKTINTNIPVVGINQITSHIKTMVTTKIQSRINNFSTNLAFLIIPRITELLPSQPITNEAVNLPHNIPLADPGFRNPAEIDGTLGAELFYDLLCVGQLTIPNSRAKLQKTKFGWVVSGKTSLQSQQHALSCNLSVQPLEKQLSKFWEIEEPPRESIMSTEHTTCENHYSKNTSRDPHTGRYIVRLPFINSNQPLGDSFSVAARRLRALEKTFLKNSDLRTKYLGFMTEYSNLGHMTIDKNPCSSKGYYLPHHAVIKQSSLTTKLRVVFDASAKTSLGKSLNNNLMTGPTIQDDLCSILIRFRLHTVVLTADIEKMYRQILVHPNDRTYQKILWRTNPEQPIQTYTLNTVTYGTSAAPFLAIRTLHQLAKDERQQFHNATTVMTTDFYVDDLLTGTQTFEEAQTLRDELIELCKKGGFKLRQWASNDERLVKSFDNRLDDTYVQLDLNETVKTLGLQWNPKQDLISYAIQNLEPKERVTKRTILSQIAALFDPLGLLGPIVVHAKILMQTLWKIKISWDESLPLELHTKWLEYYKGLHLLRELHFERQVTARDAIHTQIHGFCDASELAYGACIYLRSTDPSSNTTTRILCAKSRVAPVKTVTLPRLELCAAHLLTTLVKATMTSLRRFNIQRVVLWSDSTVTLHWLRTSPHLLKSFISHRVADIQAISSNYEWRHVPSEHNPADLISRGVTPREFLTQTLWQYGPKWLAQTESHWPTLKLEPMEIPETRSVISLPSQVVKSDILSRFSSFQHARRVIAYCLRFITNSKREPKLTGSLTYIELQTAETRIIKLLQQERFGKEINLIKADEVPNNFLNSLSPFLDKNGILRVGGRLSHANIPYETKHPILIPNDHPITIGIIRDAHLRHFHAGTQATLNSIRQRFWITRGRNSVRLVLHKCVTCYRARRSIPDYKMGNLPKDRVNRARPFQHTGVDYCGPVFIKERTHRNRTKVKVYLAIFICLATKAIHIEIVSDLTTDAFIASLRRFFSRRGKSSDIFSDNATNFIGAHRELRELYSTVRSQTYNERIAEHLSNENIRWHLIPPRSPHFGGLWEAAVKSTKHHLVRVIGETLLSYEALLTYINQIEAIVNSRPIVPLSSDPNDFTALTPAHFLIGDTLTSIPDHDFTKIPTARLSLWQHIQQMRQHFWNRWRKEYLQEQTVRKKWHSGKSENIALNQLVILREDNVPPMSWPLGRISELHAGDDGIVRVATVKTSRGNYKRCVKKLSPLPIDNPQT